MHRAHPRGSNARSQARDIYSSLVVIEIDDVLDARLAEYRGLRERGKESDEYFIVEGLTAIERLLTSRVSGAIGVADTRRRTLGSHERLGSVTTYLLSEEAMSSVAGVNLHRGAVASASRLPSPPLADVLPPLRDES